MRSIYIQHLNETFSLLVVQREFTVSVLGCNMDIALLGALVMAKPH